ncbi:hypothetical protein [Acholeplasma granularum]|uniref:hypothetical protein n=1 Tax=Acholeplasma granularum TaxID=264635 RepID=UPI000472BDCB|nr:hypothetical protein [Acholeplasma granularum]
MSWSDILILISLLLLIILVVLSIIRKRKTYLLVSTLMFMLLVGILISNLISNNHPGFSYSSIKDYDSTVPLKIENKKLISNFNSEVIYLDSFKVEVSLNIYPIYLKELDNYYLVIYSYDMNKSLEYELYTQNDYEMYRNKVDILALINKADGKLSVPRVYNLIGSTFDLSQILNKGETILLPIYKPYKSDINYYYLIQGIKKSNLTHFKTKFISLTSNKVIQKFEFLENRFITLFDNGEIQYETHTEGIISGNNNSTNFSYSTNNYEVLDNKTFVKMGYFTTHHNKFYILNDDMAIYLLEGEVLTKIKTIEDINDFYDEVYAIT